MNSLEFIESFIKHAEEEIEYFKKRIEEDAIYPSLKQCHELELESAIKSNETLHQIKTILEAWEVARDEIRVKKVENNFYIYTKYENGLINKQQYEAFKKALEVKDNGTTN